MHTCTDGNGYINSGFNCLILITYAQPIYIQMMKLKAMTNNSIQLTIIHHGG